MSQSRHQIHFHEPLKKDTKEAIVDYIETFPHLYWQYHINVHFLKQEGFLLIKDKKKEHKLYDCEVRTLA